MTNAWKSCLLDVIIKSLSKFEAKEKLNIQHEPFAESFDSGVAKSITELSSESSDEQEWLITYRIHAYE